MKKIAFKIIFTLVFLASYSQAQVPDTLKPGDTLHIQHGDTLAKDYCAICRGHVHTVIYAPYYNDFKRQLPFLITSSAIYAGGFILASVNKHPSFTANEVMQFDKNSVNSFDRVSTGYWSPSASRASDYLLFGISVLPVAFLSEHHTKKDIYPLVVMASEAYLFNYGVTTICKNLTHRTRPYVYNTSVSIDTRTGAGSRESFFSGHTSQTAAATFLFANVLSDYHPNMEKGLAIGMWTFAATVPALEGYLRMRAGKHYPSDVITGYVIGAASGWVIPRLHRYQKAHYKYGLGFLPYKDGMMVAMNYRL